MSFTDGMVVTLNKKLRNFKKAVTSIRRRKGKKDSRLQPQDLRQSLDAINEENVSIRKQIKQKQTEIEEAKQENLTLKEEYETKEVLFEEDRRYLCHEIRQLQIDIEDKRTEWEKLKRENLALKGECITKQVLLEEDRGLFSKEIEFLKNEVQEKRCEIELGREANALLKEEYEELLTKARKDNETLQKDKHKLEEEIKKLKTNLEEAQAQIARNVQAKNTDKIISSENKDVFVQEIESLKTVLELNQNYIKDMRLALAGAKQKEETLEAAVEKARAWRAKCEDFQEQLKIKSENEQSLVKEISTLRKALLEENAQKKRMSYQNEELQWKLRRNKDSIGSTLQVAPGTSKVERVVKKRGSIGYVLDLDESPRKIVKTNVQSGWIQGPKSGKRRPNEVTF